jgi:hypothetical protein
MRVFQEEKTFFIRLVELIFPEGPITEDIDAKKVEGLSDGLIHLGGILNDRRSCFDPGNFFYLEINLFRKASSERGDLEIGLSRNVIHRGIEGFDGGVYGHLDADEDGHPKGDPYDGKKGPSFMVTKMAEGDGFEKVN